MKDEDRKLSEEEFKKKYEDIALAPYRRARLEEKRRRKAKEEKAIEESVAKAEKQRKEELLEKVAEVVSGDTWFDRVRTFIQNAVSNSETEILTMFLVREKDDIWSFEAIIGMEKPKGVQYIKVNFSDVES